MSGSSLSGKPLSKGPQIKVNAMSYAKLIKALWREPKTLDGLALETGLHVWTVRNYVKALHREEVIHICKWLKDSLGRDCTPVYAFGMGVDAVRTAKTAAQKGRERRARRKAELLTAQKASWPPAFTHDPEDD